MSDEHSIYFLIIRPICHESNTGMNWKIPIANLCDILKNATTLQVYVLVVKSPFHTSLIVCKHSTFEKDIS